MKYIVSLVIVVLILAGGWYFFMNKPAGIPELSETPGTATTTEGTATTTENGARAPEMSIGKSVQGRDIMAYSFGTGETELLFVGGIHGGYEWNTALVAYELIDHLKANPTAVPENLRVTVIPVLNPDGLHKVVGTTEKFAKESVPATEAGTVPGRFNGNGVDLNRNFDCDWQETGMWRNTEVKGGSAAFSEPESQAMREFVETYNPKAVVVWYSAAGGVFASNCHDGVLPETTTLTKLFADASRYPAYQSFNFYEITGDMVNWLAKEGIPAISVLLTNHTDTEWDKNRAGVEAVINHYAQQE